ncbi:MAG: spore maturation protein [Marinilabiliales bacterium]|nr:spore maturation protein [Marinilabiliales bacterium]
MALNYIWIFFFVIAFVIALVKLILFGNTEVFPELVNSTFDMAKTGFEISIGLTGVLTFWSGIMKIGEKGGIVNIVSRLIGPFFNKLFPELGKNHPAYGPMMLNFAANMLGLDNAATPMGLQAMKEMQESNPNKEVASNAQIMFLVLNASGLCLIPIAIMVYRAQMGAADPSDIFLPIMLATFFANMTGLISVSIIQKINLLDRTVLAYLLGTLGFIALLIWSMSHMTEHQISLFSKLASNIILFSLILFFILLGVKSRINVYETFIDGAKEGFNTAVRIIPYLVAILVAIGVFRASGAMDFLVAGIKWVFDSLGINSEFVAALPTALMKPLSGSGSRGMMIDAMKMYGADSFIGKLSCTVQGVSDTTFFILALYFGSVGVKKTRHAVACALLADFVGMIAAILIGYLFFH